MRNKEIKVKNGYILYENDIVKITRELNKTLFYESVKYDFRSFDTLTSVVWLMKFSSMKNDFLWNIEIPKNWNYSVNDCLYILTGDDDVWKVSTKTKHKWEDISDIYIHKYNDILIDIFENSKTLKDIREGINKKISIESLYEFSLSNDLINI